MKSQTRGRRSQSTPAAGDTDPSSGAGRWLLLSALFLALAAGAWWGLRNQGLALVPRADQNVLLVTIDALRADALSVAGGEARTPVLDRLAGQGVRFTFAHAHAATTLPSHASLMTGLMPYEHGVRDNDGYRLRPGSVTLASRLQAAGFATGAFVGSSLLDERFGLASGFDVYDDRTNSAPDLLDLEIAERPADAVVRAALNWLGQQPERWFGWVHLADPHAPYTPAEAFRARAPSDPYLAEVAAADAALESLFQRLADESRPTLVIVTADHGEGLGDHSEETHGLFAYETTLHVPLILAWVDPAATDARGGFTVDAPARLIDVVPTVLQAVALPADASLPGASLGELMLDGTTTDRPIYFEAMSANVMRGWAPLRGVISGRRKYIDLPIPELYNLANDPGELRNLAGIDAGGTEELRRLLDTFDRREPGRPADATPEVFEHLRAVGYVSAKAPALDRNAEADDPKRLIELDRLMDASLVALEEGRFEDAASALQQVILARPGNAEAYLDLALLLWRGGRPDQAIVTLRAALNVGLTQGGIRVKLARMLALTGGSARAIQLLEGHTGDNLDALGALGIAYSQVGRDRDAEQTFERMLDISATSANAHENLGVLRLRQNRLADAEVLLRRAIALEPAASSSYTPLGVTLSEQGRIDEAIDAWTTAVQFDAAEYLALFNLTVALASQNRAEDARSRGEQFLRTAPASLYAEQLAQVRILLSGR